MGCKRRRETARAEELALRVPERPPVGFVGSVLHECPGLVSDVDAATLECIALSCPNLEFLDISETAINRITGDELGRFVAGKRKLKGLKMEGCSNLGGFNLRSRSLSTLWLSGLHNSLPNMTFNCRNLKEISIDFYREENDNADLVPMVNELGKNCPKLQKIHIASVRLSHAAVLALTAAELRGLQMLSLVHGYEITNKSVDTIASSYPKLKLLDLSGSSISDCGMKTIASAFRKTLSTLIVARCPEITASGIMVATDRLSRLEVMDCGMSMNSGYRQNMLIDHSRLKNLSLSGRSDLHLLRLCCPELNSLNLTSCKNLHPERMVLECPSLKTVHASGCQESLIEVIQSQVGNDCVAKEYLSISPPGLRFERHIKLEEEESLSISPPDLRLDRHIKQEEAKSLSIT